MAYTVQLENADRMMTRARASGRGLDLAFADGHKGLIPFTDLPEIGDLSNLEALELPNPYEIILRSRDGHVLELPWDFGRSYCDLSYRSKVEAIASAGRQSLGGKLRQLREAASLTQESLAARADIGRVTLSRIETGEQSPRHETLLALARALDISPAELFDRISNESND
jgi:DNA-binding XRE family transcriptional regulator